MTTHVGKLPRLRGNSPVDSATESSELESGTDKELDVNASVARSLQRNLRLLNDEFWAELPASFETIKLRNDGLAVSLRLPFLRPSPSGESGEWLSTQKAVDTIRNEFAAYLREKQSVAKRLATFFYTEFHDFLLGYTRGHRFNPEIVKMIKRPGERRMAGRPHIPIPERRVRGVRRQVRTVFSAVLEMQSKIKTWKRTSPSITEGKIRDRLELEFDCTRYPWTRYAFRDTKTLPVKPYHETRVGFDQPNKWSCPDVAVKWTQDWFYYETGHRYDLRHLKRLLVKSRARRP